MLRGKHGAAHSQTLRLTNNTAQTLAFDMEAMDVVTRDGQRIFVPAGEESRSIAATAVFSQKEVVIPAGATGEVTVTLTVVPETAIRAVAVLFRGKTTAGSRAGVGMTASLGSLLTFTLSDHFRVEPSPVEVTKQTDSANVAFSQWLTNAGMEPVIANGVVAVLSEKGTLVGKVPIQPQRLLPGEKLEFRTDYPSQLSSGQYHAVLSLQYEDKVLTTSADLVVRPAMADTVADSSAAQPPER